MKLIFKTLACVSFILVLALGLFLVAMALLPVEAHGQQLVGELTVQKDIVMTSYTPAVTTAKIYNIGGTLYWAGTPLAPGGAVTSVGLSMPTGFTVTNSPVMGAGTLTVTTSLSGMLKGADGAFAVATADVDYEAPHTTLAGYGITNGVPSTRTINSLPLSGNLVLTPVDLGASTVGGNLFALANPSAITFIRINAANTVDALGAADFRTAIGAGTSSLTDPVTETHGGTNQTTYTLGDTLYSSAANTLLKLAGNTTSTRKFLRQTGTGGGSPVSAAPAWDTLTSTDVGLASVTNDAQTKASIVPNTAPNAGQILVGNAGNTAYAPQAMGTDATLSSAGALTIANAAVTLAKMANMATASLIYRKSAGAGAPEVNTLATLKTDLAFAVGDLAAVANNTILGNISGGAAAPSALTGSNVRTICGLATTDTPRFLRLGIGAPADAIYKLYIYGTDNDQFVLDSDAGSRFTSFQMWHAGSAHALFQYDHTGSNFRITSGTGILLSFGTEYTDWVTINSTGNMHITSGSIQTGTPTGGTAAAWKLGIAATVNPTSPNRTIQLDVGGTLYYLAAKTTDD
jgi:hypothetical protein